MAKKSVSKQTKKDLNFKGEKLVCYECKNPIKRQIGTYVLLGTYNHPSKPDEQNFFHFPCFVDWHTKKVNEKAQGLVAQQQNVLSLVNDPKLRELAGNVLQEIFSDEECDCENCKPPKKKPKVSKKPQKTKKATSNNDKSKKREKAKSKKTNVQ